MQISRLNGYKPKLIAIDKCIWNRDICNLNADIFIQEINRYICIWNTDSWILKRNICISNIDICIKTSDIRIFAINKDNSIWNTHISI